MESWRRKYGFGGTIQPIVQVCLALEDKASNSQLQAIAESQIVHAWRGIVGTTDFIECEIQICVIHGSRSRDTSAHADMESPGIRRDRTPNDKTGDWMARDRSRAGRMDLLLAIAAQHHGLMTRAQLLDAGLTRNFIDGRVKCGLLGRVHAGVYQFGPISAAHARERAALLACNGGVIGHRSAAGLWQLPPDRPMTDPVDVILCTGRHRGVRPGIRIHRCVPRTDEVTSIDGMPVTTLARTLLDIGGTGVRDLERALSVAERLKPGLRDELTMLVARYPKRCGTGTLRALLADTSSGTFTRSQAEENLLKLVRAAGLPRPEMNVTLHGYEVDFLWRNERLVVEVDGFEFHSSHRASFKTVGATVS